MANEKAGRGRPPVDIPMDKLESLCEIGCTNREIAAHFGVSERTIELRRNKEVFRTAMERGVARANISLRRKQLTLALEGDKTMLIWLGKQRLGQQDRIAAEHSGQVAGGAPPKINVNFISAKRETAADEEPAAA